MLRLQVTIGRLPGWCPKHRTTLYTAGWRVSYSITPTIIFILSSLFSLLHFKKCVALQNCRVIINLLIILNLIYLFFNFISCHLIYLCFLSNLILILLIFIYFAFNLFFDWILFFDLISNHLIFLKKFDSHSYYCKFFLLWVLFLINCFFRQFHPLLFNFIKFSYHIWCSFFYHAFKT